jgi:hypothetical protein
MVTSDWSSDVCSSDLLERVRAEVVRLLAEYQRRMDPDAGGGHGPGADES